MCQCPTSPSKLLNLYPASEIYWHWLFWYRDTNDNFFLEYRDSEWQIRKLPFSSTYFPTATNSVSIRFVVLWYLSTPHSFSCNCILSPASIIARYNRTLRFLRCKSKERENYHVFSQEIEQVLCKPKRIQFLSYFSKSSPF